MIISRDVIKSWKWRTAKAGKTLTQLSEQSGVHLNTISNAILGKIDTRFNNICAVEKVLVDWGQEYEPEKTA